MNEREAFLEAQRRWGRDAHVRHLQGELSEGQKPYAVGRWLGRSFQMLGQGESWEEAFQAANDPGEVQ